jgi:hypothetical protein
MDARERGTEKEVDDFLLDFFNPVHWPQWQPMLQEMLRVGPEKRKGKVAQYRLNKAKRQREAAVKDAAKVSPLSRLRSRPHREQWVKRVSSCVWFAADQSVTAPPRDSRLLVCEQPGASFNLMIQRARGSRGGD